MPEEALYYEKLSDNKVQCKLCPHQCVIADGKRGFCRVRENQNGQLQALNYGLVASVAMDPIEKKPLYHFYPGTRILSLGQAGCTFHCQFCQNYSLLDPDIPQQSLPPEQAVAMAKQENSLGIAYTYNEPYVGFEYVLDTAREAKKADLKNVLVTNGYYMPDPWEKLSPLIDGMNIDLKSMRDEFYKEYINGGLAPVQQTIKSALQKGIHVELTTLLITGLNDSEEEMRELVGYVAGLDPDLPLHLSRYHPAYKMDRPATPPETLKQAYEIAREQLNYVYIGNIMGVGGTDSECPRCGAVLVNRSGYSTHIVGLEGNKCGECGGEVNFAN